MTNRFMYVGSAYLFLIENDQILLHRRYQTGFADGMYGVPSGHLDGDETTRGGCAREIQEEIGLQINPNDLSVVHVMHRKAEHDERIDFFMLTKTYRGEIRNRETHKCDDIRFFSLDALPENMVEYVRYALSKYQEGVFYSEYGWEHSA